MTSQIKISVNGESRPYESVPVAERTALEKAVYNSTMEYKKHFNTNGEAQFYSRLLAYFYPRILMKKYPELRFREYTDIVKADTYSKKVVFEMYDMVGHALAKNHRAGDIGVVDTNVTEMESNILSVTGGIRWDYVEFKAAMETEAKGGKVQFARLKALSRFFEQRLNDWFFQGDDTYGITGLLNNPAIPTSSAPVAWSTATNDEKLTDLITTYTNVLDQSKNIFVPNVMAMSLSAFVSVFGQPRSVYSDESILSWVQTKLPGIRQIIADPYLDGVGAGGSNVIVAMHKDVDHFNMAIPMEMVGLPPVFQGTDYFLPFIARSSGLNILQADSIHIKDGL